MPDIVSEKKDLKNNKKNNFLIIVIPLILLSFIFGFWLSNLNLKRENAERVRIIKVYNKENADIDFSLFWETWEQIEAHFIDINEIDRQKMVEGAISGMVDTLEDPHTKFLDEQETKLKEQELRGEFGGIGIALRFINEYLTIISIFDETPADLAGLQSGDKIISIDKNNTKNLTIQEVVSLIRGEKGTNVVLSILRRDWAYPQEFKITRDTIKIPSIEWELKNNQIAYINIYKFSINAGNDFSKIVDEILNSPADRIILDLRNNPGGSLKEVIEVANHFLKQDDTILIKRRKNRQDERILQKFNGGLSELPIKVLINQNSASGAEILAAALRDNRQVVLIGETTFGKGSAQEMILLRDIYSILITTTEWLTPAGNYISEKGIAPCYLVEKTLEDFINNQDPQLEKAIELILEE